MPKPSQTCPEPDLSTGFLFFSVSYFYFIDKKLLYRNGLSMVTGTNRGTAGTNRGSKGTNRGTAGTNRGDGDLLVDRVPFSVPAWPS
jgi:hypothetical protein